MRLSHNRTWFPFCILLLSIGLLVACSHSEPAHPSGIQCIDKAVVPGHTADPTSTPHRAEVSNAPLLWSSATSAECPTDLDCSFIPAQHAPNKPNPEPYDYGNYAFANRPHDGLDIRYIIIHNTEVDYTTTLRVFQDTRAQVTSHYIVNTDGSITQSVKNRDVAWHAGNLYFNAHAIGIEHVGVAIEGNTWYTDEMYRASALLVRSLAAQYRIPLNRAHIFGHAEVPARLPDQQGSMNWDPGVFWDWAYYMELLGAPLEETDAPANSTIVTIHPDFATNTPPLTYCYAHETLDCREVPPQGANFIYLHTEPDPQAPLLHNRYLDIEPTHANNWGSKAVMGQQFYRVERQGEWDALYFSGQRAWLYNPENQNTIPAPGLLITPKPERETIPVYGHPYLEIIAYSLDSEPLEPVPIYGLPAGQVYVALEKVKGEYYTTPPYTHTRTRAVYEVSRGKTDYYRISFNHRFGFVRADDVDVVACRVGTELIPISE